MPTYEYECRACGHRFEKLQKMSDKQVRTCPECGKRRVRRLISAGGGVVFKGPGFYATDYRSEPGPKPPSEGSSASKNKDGDTKSSGKDGSDE